MSSANKLNPMPVFLPDDSGQPAWAVLRMEHYQDLLEAAGLAKESKINREHEPTVREAETAQPNATAQLISSLAESAAQSNVSPKLQFDVEKLRAKRSSTSMGIDELARSAGISPSYTSMIERGEREPSLPILNSFARALGVSVSALMSEQD